ncbi:hypothetical protein ABTY20_01540 [Streptomyces sp. NPDC126497]|uniref:hypothetical protein n=1 Tax=Streptomyces sp. NPDC126497 TaxID=3155313 RepID=UPI0033316C96
MRSVRRPERTRLVPVVLPTGFARDPRPGAAAYVLGAAGLRTRPVDPWTPRTEARHLHDAHRRRPAPDRGVRVLRARLGERTGVPARPVPPHPHAHVPPGRPAGAHTGELERDRT